MLAYRNVVLLILLCSLIIVIAGWVFSFLTIWLVLPLILIDLFTLFAGSFIIDSGLYLKVFCSGNPAEKSIAITFDDGPDPLITPQLLDILKEHSIKAGFFLTGKNITGNENVVKRIAEEGHVMGNHSFSHSSRFGFFSKKKLINDLNMNASLIEKISGKKVNFFRPPFGVTNPNIAKAVRSLDYFAIGWNIRSYDTVCKNDEKIIKRVVKRFKPGGIILFHDNHKGILLILKSVIEKADEAGYSIISPDELLNINAYK